MIFLLDVSVGDLHDVPAEEIESLFTTLLDADRSGRHLAVIDRNLCTWGIDNIKLSGQNKTHLANLREQFATRGNIHGYAKSYLKIVIGNDQVEVIDNFFKIGHYSFISGEFATSKTKMIVENLNADRKLYEYLFSIAIKQTNVPGFAVDFVLGGGNTTVTAFEAEIEKYRISVCVVDTDRISPCDRLGDTAKKVVNRHTKRNLKIADPAPAYVGTALETIGHELENYIPFSVIKVMECFNCPDIIDTIVSQDTQNNSMDCFWLYFDTKKGLNGRALQDKVQKGLKPASTIEWVCLKTGIAEDRIDSLEIPQIGKAIVDQFLKNGAAKAKYVDFSRTEHWRSLFLSHFEQILWFLAAPQVSRS